MLKSWQLRIINEINMNHCIVVDCKLCSLQEFAFICKEVSKKNNEITIANPQILASWLNELDISRTAIQEVRESTAKALKAYGAKYE